MLARAQLVGEQTFGKGVVQYYFPINNDGGVKLTVAKYLTPHRCEHIPLRRFHCCLCPVVGLHTNLAAWHMTCMQLYVMTA